ncbi:MAG: hypothetical protein ACI4EA_10830 [Candidatus Ornithomonoglobus sp.]
MRKTKFKKWLLAAFCMLLTTVFTIAPAYAADDDGTEEETTKITVSLSLPEGCDYTDDGITVTVSIGSMPSAGGGGIRTYGDGHIGYNSIYEGIPATVYRNRIRASQSMEITFNEGETEKTAEFDVENDRLSGALRAQYLINDDRYMGSKIVNIRNNSAAFNIECVEKITLSGAVNLGDTDKDVYYTVYAEENRRIEDNIIVYDYADVFYGTISAGTGISEYSLNIRPDKDYTVIISFEEHEFVRQYKEIRSDSGNMALNFDSFEKSPEITGTILLPEGFANNEVSGAVFFQSAEPPYFESEICDFDFSNKAGECGFTLLNDMNAGSIVICYVLYDNTEGLYYGGNYVDDTSCANDISQASVLDGSGKNIVMNMIEHSSAYPIEIGEPYITADNKYAVDIFNSTDTIYGLNIYTADYENGVLTGIKQRTADADSRKWLTVEIEKAYSSQYLFVWDGMRSVSPKTALFE